MMWHSRVLITIKYFFHLESHCFSPCESHPAFSALIWLSFPLRVHRLDFIKFRRIISTFEPPPLVCTELSIKRYTVCVTRFVWSEIERWTKSKERRYIGGAGMVFLLKINRNWSAARFRYTCIVFIDFIRKQKFDVISTNLIVLDVKIDAINVKVKFYTITSATMYIVHSMCSPIDVYICSYTFLYMHNDNMIDLVFNVRFFETRKNRKRQDTFANVWCWRGWEGKWVPWNSLKRI